MDYLVDEDGKLVTDDTVYVEIGASGNPNACVLSLCSENQELNDIIVAWGKTSAVFSSQEPGTADYTITIGDDFVNVVEETATPAIEDFPAPTIICTPTLPANISSGQNLQIRKSDGSYWTEQEILSIKINGNSATAGNTISWVVEGVQLTYNRNTATDVATIQSTSGKVTITAVNFAE